MKAKHGSTKSERKKYRTDLHEHDINNYVSIQVTLIIALMYTLSHLLSLFIQ